MQKEMIEKLDLIGGRKGAGYIAKHAVILATFLASLIISFFPLSVAFAVDSGKVDFFSSTFRVVACDGPENLNHINPATGKIEQDYYFDREDRAGFEREFGHAPPFVPCNFRGVMIQVQHVINILMVAGVFAAILAFSWGGLLYISGDPGKIKTAHAIFPKVFLGFIIMLSAWFIVYQILSWFTKNNAFKALLVG